jgi:hypothetical protein
MRKKPQVPHSRFANLQPIQIHSPSFFSKLQLEQTN